MKFQSVINFLLIVIFCIALYYAFQPCKKVIENMSGLSYDQLNKLTQHVEQRVHYSKPIPGFIMTD